MATEPAPINDKVKEAEWLANRHNISKVEAVHVVGVAKLGASFFGARKALSAVPTSGNVSAPAEQKPEDVATATKPTPGK